MQVVIGRVGRPHGVRGELTIELRTDQPDERFAPGSVLGTQRPTSAGTQTGGVAARGADATPQVTVADAVTVVSARWHSSRLLVRFEGIDDRMAADHLRDTLLVADVGEDEQTDDPDEFYDHQLVGLAVQLADGTTVGEVGEVLHLPMQDLLAVRLPDDREVLVPFVGAIVVQVDVARGRVTVDPPEGLLDEAAPESEISRAGERDGEPEGG